MLEIFAVILLFVILISLACEGVALVTLVVKLLIDFFRD